MHSRDLSISGRRIWGFPLCLCLSITFLFLNLANSFEVSQAARQTRADRLKSEKADYVPGEILVRFREGEEVVSEKERSTTLTLSGKGRNITSRLERLSLGDEIVQGLRLARVRPEDTMSAIQLFSERKDVLY